MERAVFLAQANAAAPRTMESAIAEAPVFRPSAKEFADPMSYLTTIEPEVRKFGICKIIPPSERAPTWNAVAWASDDAKFETKEQHIHALREGRTFKVGKNYTKSEYEAHAKAYEAKRLKAVAEAGAKGDGVDADAAASTRLEACYWDIVELQRERVIVDYGNDLDTKVLGTMFATESDGMKHPWDFEQLFEHPLNLLRSVEHDIPGVTKPWLYLGMLFATFCWHVEDHFLCSLNYLHRGASKTWYGIPGVDAEAFENCARATVPHLFDKAPDLLHQIVTMVPPGVLVQHGVKVVHLVQNAGEFVVTFPRAYHAGFSHGFNVAEAVNFGHINWLDYGRKAVDVYSKGAFKRNALFAHHRLVINAAKAFAHALDVAGDALHSKSMNALLSTLRKEVEILLSDEQYFRASLIRRGLQTTEVKQPAEDDDACCVKCKSIPYLSVVRCRCLPTAVRCLSHAMDACDCNPEDRCLEIRASEVSLRDILLRLFPEDAVGAKRNAAAIFVASAPPTSVANDIERARIENEKKRKYETEQREEKVPVARVADRSDLVKETQPLPSTMNRSRMMRWTPEERMNFLKALDQLGRGCFAAKKQFIPTRTAKQIRKFEKRHFDRIACTALPSICIAPIEP